MISARKHFQPKDAILIQAALQGGDNQNLTQSDKTRSASSGAFSAAAINATALPAG
jgi:hypothetical protein